MLLGHIKNFKFLKKFQVHSTFLTVATMLYKRYPELSHVVTGSLSIFPFLNLSLQTPVINFLQHSTVSYKVDFFFF